VSHTEQHRGGDKGDRGYLQYIHHALLDVLVQVVPQVLCPLSVSTALYVIGNTTDAADLSVDHFDDVLS
jgi:hypothetical protein